MTVATRSASSTFSAEIREGFKNAQRLSYAGAVAIAQELREGWTEKQAAALYKTYLQDHGVRSFFHEPFAWFGGHSRFTGMKNYFEFVPSNKIYLPDEPAILDAAPILDGYVGDIGYSFCHEPAREFIRAQTVLRVLRENIPKWAMEFYEDAPALWRRVDEEIRNAGYENMHQAYPFAVLGHQVHRLPLSRFRLRTPVPFSLHSIFPAFIYGVQSQLLNLKHKGNLHGMWAIEPHLGATDFGVKFEEILVVEEAGAAWLDDNVPHHSGKFLKIVGEA